MDDNIKLLQKETERERLENEKEEESRNIALGHQKTSEEKENRIMQLYESNKALETEPKSSDDPLDFVAQNFPNVRLIQNKDNLGFAYECNVGIRAARGDRSF